MIESIEKGFRFRKEEEMSLREYYEKKEKNTLFEDKKYSLKYGGLRNTGLYIKLIVLFMLTKTIISIGIGVTIGLSPLRNSALAKILITITGG